MYFQSHENIHLQKGTLQVTWGDLWSLNFLFSNSAKAACPRIVLTCSLQSPGILLTAPGAALIDFHPSLKKVGRPVLDENICQHCPVPADSPPINEDPLGVRRDAGNRFEDRCRVDVRDGFARKRILPSVRWCGLPQTRGYPCRHLLGRRRRPYCEAHCQTSGRPRETLALLHPEEGRGHNHSYSHNNQGHHWERGSCKTYIFLIFISTISHWLCY